MVIKPTLNPDRRDAVHRVSTSNEIIRKWIFYAKTHDDADFYLDDFGNEIDYSDAVPFIGNNHGAILEAERRANLWEDGKNGLLAEITYESQGIV